MIRRLILRGAEIVTPHRVVGGGALVIEDGIIADVLETVPSLAGDDVLWVGGIVTPGFVDVHSDALEREIRPRPNAIMPVDIALAEFDRKCAGHGITTLLHAVAVTEEEGARSQHEAVRVAGALAERRPNSLIRHLFHARYELTDIDAAPAIHGLVAAGQVRMISFMDHTPGGRQYPERKDYVAYFSRAYGFTEEKTEQVVAKKLHQKQHARAALDAAVAGLADAARLRGVVLASHDDDSAADIAQAADLGVTIAEFPITTEAAGAAKAAGLHIVMGAPNVVRGGSTGGNLSAREALRTGVLDVPCSDYYPASMLHAVTRLVADGDAGLPDAVRLATLAPARAVGLGADIGSLEPGKTADILVIDRRGGVAAVTHTFREGREVFRVA